MDTNEYYQQLIQINTMLQSTRDDNQKQELLCLKQNIEELLSLTVEEPNKMNNDSIEDEYSLFMTEMAKEGAVSQDNTSSTQNPYKHIEGKKFRAPHAHHFGQTVYHNAMVCSVPSTISPNEDFEVRVLFLNPTHQEMLPCPYYFDIDKDCKFTDEKCRFSHGETVPYSTLQEYVEPKFEQLTIGSYVLAKQNNDLWYQAKVKHIADGKCTVKFETKTEMEEIGLGQVLPLGTDEDGSEEETTAVENIDEAIINTSLMNTPSDQALGSWEKHTKGIGSKLMQKMGYIVGAGLGKNGAGRVDPVRAVIFPPGKSLDYCLKLREQHGGDANLFCAERKMKRLQRKQKAADEKSTKRIEQRQDVFSVINKALRTSELGPAEEKRERQQFRESLKTQSEKDLNVAGVMLHENIVKYERSIETYKESLGRYKDANSPVHKKLLDKITYGQDLLKVLRAKSIALKNEQQIRIDKKKMTVF